MAALMERFRSIFAVTRSANWSRERLEAYQGKRLCRLVRHAYEHVPFYRDLWKRNGVHPDDIRGLPDFRRLPIAERAEMQERGESDLVARGYRPERLVRHRTSGSTGSPFTILRTQFEERLLHGARLLEQRRLGLRFTDVRTLTTIGDRHVDQPFFVRFGVLRKPRVDCLLPAREILARLGEIRPDIVGGYAGTLAWVAAEATEEDRRRIRPRMVFTGAETLSPEMRRQIGDCFGAPVYEFYGAHEFNLLAHECRETGLYHVMESSILVEILRDGTPVEPGESGELVGTALHSFAMPFIRYRLGDVVTRGPARCPCGAPCQTIESIQGRVMDRFHLPGGGTIHPYELIHPLAQRSPWLRRYQIIQTKRDHIVVKAVPFHGLTPTESDWNIVRSHYLKVLGDDVTLEFQVVKDLPPGENGKFRPYYTLVQQ